jgi:hypothetical protein
VSYHIFRAFSTIHSWVNEWRNAYHPRKEFDAVHINFVNESEFDPKDDLIEA